MSVLALGQYFGWVPRRWAADSIALSPVIHDQPRVNVEHQHQAAFVTVMLDGENRETAGLRTFRFDRFTALYHPPGIEHQDFIGASGVRLLLFEFQLEAWTDDQWIAWLDATDDPDAPDDSDGGHGRHWSRGRSASVLGAAMLGLHDAIYGPRRNEIVIVVDAGGDPPGDDLPEVHLDPEHPEHSEVIVRRDNPKPRPEPSESPRDP